MRNVTMFEKRKLFLGLSVLYFLIAAAPASAVDENDAVLIKIQDIKPIKNDQGITTECEFLSTIYNRSDSDILELSLNLDWLDEAARDTISQEKTSTSNGRKNLRGTENYISPNVVATLNIPVLKKNSQKTMVSKVASDRCFILLEDAQIDVSSCKKDSNTTGKELSCQSLFRYISSRSPQYYTDFLAVSPEAQKEIENKEKERQSQELDVLFRNIELNINKASRILKSTVANDNHSPATGAENKTTSAPDVFAPQSPAPNTK